MKKAWSDIKSFVTVVMTLAFIAFTALKYITGEQFYTVFQLVIAFYFGTQIEKLSQMKEELKTLKEGGDNNGE
jgi:hypothetical protein